MWQPRYRERRRRFRRLMRLSATGYGGMPRRSWRPPRERFGGGRASGARTGAPAVRLEDVRVASSVPGERGQPGALVQGGFAAIRAAGLRTFPTDEGSHRVPKLASRPPAEEPKPAGRFETAAGPRSSQVAGPVDVRELQRVPREGGHRNEPGPGSRPEEIRRAGEGSPHSHELLRPRVPSRRTEREYERLELAARRPVRAEHGAVPLASRADQPSQGLGADPRNVPGHHEQNPGSASPSFAESGQDGAGGTGDPARPTVDQRAYAGRKPGTKRAESFGSVDGEKRSIHRGRHRLDDARDDRAARQSSAQLVGSEPLGTSARENDSHSCGRSDPRASHRHRETSTGRSPAGAAIATARAADMLSSVVPPACARRSR
jgi:hypothetical protein